MSQNTKIKILQADKDWITLEVNGEERQISNNYTELEDLLNQKETLTFQSADKLYNINSINQANFYLVIDRAEANRSLAEEVLEELSLSENKWIESLREELKEQKNVSVGIRPGAVFNHYGWLIETFLLKMASKVALEDEPRRLSFMTEAYQNSLRYLCYIQLARLLSKPNLKVNLDFFELREEDYDVYDFLNLLWQASQQTESPNTFIPDLDEFIDELFDSESELYDTVVFLDRYRSLLITNSLPDDKPWDQILDEYLAALVHWLRNISFLAQYRLVSIKDVNLNYQLGTSKNYIHTIGELHGMYNEDSSDFNTRTLEEVFTYSRSVLLLKGSSVSMSMDKIIDSNSYLSLSPLIIDQSVYSNKETQTPEVYYYIGKGNGQYSYAQYRNELLLSNDGKVKSNKYIHVKKQNTRQPKWNKLYKQIDHVFNQFKGGNR